MVSDKLILRVEKYLLHYLNLLFPLQKLLHFNNSLTYPPLCIKPTSKYYYFSHFLHLQQITHCPEDCGGVKGPHRRTIDDGTV